LLMLCKCASRVRNGESTASDARLLDLFDLAGVHTPETSEPRIYQVVVWLI
jgi:hypothetical protein